MANFFSIQNGNLSDISTYGYSLTGAEIMNNTTGTMLLTSSLYSTNYFSDASTLSAIAVHLSARSANPTGTLGLTVQRTASAGIFLDSSSNNFIITTVGSAYQSNLLTPFSPNDGSVYFGGNTYLSLPTSSIPSLTFGTGDFTVEGWIYPRVTLLQYEGICGGSSGTNNSFSIQTQTTPADNKLCITTQAANILQGTIALVNNQWNHFAVSRSAGKLLLYINGLSSAQAVGNTTSFAEIQYIGGISTSSFLRNSYISNFRVIKGTGLYTTASFTPSTAPLTNITNTSLLLNTSNYGPKASATETYAISSFTSYDGSNNLLSPLPKNWQILKLTNPLSTNRGDVINYSLSTSSPNQLSLIGSNTVSAIDTTGVNRLSTVGSPTLTSFKPYTNFDDSWYLNGTTDWFVMPSNSNFSLSGDFTIETWINTSVFSTDIHPRRIFSFGLSAANNLQLVFANNTGTASEIVSINTALSTIILSGTIPVANGQWHHVAVSRYSNILRLYVDGVQSGVSAANSTHFNAGVTSPLSIGSYNNSAISRLSAAYINQFRIVNGTSVYTTSSFTPPTTPLTVIPNTVLLLKNGVRYDQALISSNLALTGSVILNNITLSSVSIPFGTGLHNAFRFSGNNSYITFPANNWFTGDFNIELFLYWTGGAGQNNLLQGGINLNIPLDLAATWGLGNSGAIQNNFGSSLTKNVWHHIIISKFNGVVKCFVDGTKIHEGANSTAYSSNNTVTVGNTNTTNYMNGFISNIRITNKPTYSEVLSAISIPKVPLNLLFETNALLNSSNFNLSSYDFYNIKLDDIHIGGALKGLNTEPRTITVDNFNSENIYIHNQGTLIFPLTSSTTLNVNGSAGLQITSDGTLNIGTSSSSIPLSTTHTITLSNTQIDVHNGGNFNVYGFPETTTTSLVSTHPIGSRTFTTTSNISSNWKVGDVLSFKPNISARRSFDELILSSFTGPNRFTTTSNSLCTHTGSADQFAFIPDVYNLTRNVNIQGLNTTAKGVIRTIDASKTSINYAQLNNFGINNSNKTGLMFSSNSNGSTTLSGTVINSGNTSIIINAPLTGRIFQNITINNNIFNKSNVVTLSALSVNNVNISNNYILSSGGIGLQINNLSGSISMSNNTTIGSLNYGTYLFNNTLTGTHGANNYNSALQGMMVSGTNIGTIIGGSINSAREGVYVDTTTSNLSGVTFQNISANNNSNVGFKVSGNNLNYLTPVILNINGLNANTNNDSGFEGYNIIGNISSLTVNNNLSGGVKTSIGNGPTTFDGLTSILSSIPVNILSGFNYSALIIRNTLLSSNSSVGIRLDSTRFSKFSLENSIISASTPIQLNITRNLIEGSYLFNNTFLGSINFIDLTKYQPNAIRTVGFGFTNYNKIAGNHFTYLPMGVKAVDTLLYDSSTSDLISERLTPTSRTIKLCSGTKYVALNSGEDTLVKVNILVSSSYTGNPPRLMVRRNPAAGIYSDTVLSVFAPAMGYDIFTQLTGAKTLPVIDNAVLEFYIDCDGTTGYVCVDTWTAN